MSKHTPGPWAIYRPDSAKPAITAGACGVYVAEIITQGLGYAGPANARLIAAAPDMLAALLPLAEYAAASKHPVIIRAVEAACAAIAKAEGG